MVYLWKMNIFIQFLMITSCMPSCPWGLDTPLVVCWILSQVAITLFFFPPSLPPCSLRQCMWCSAMCHSVTRPSVTVRVQVCVSGALYGDTKCGHGLCPLGTQQHHLYQLEDTPLIITLLAHSFSTCGDYGNEIFFYNIHTHNLKS